MPKTGRKFLRNILIYLTVWGLLTGLMFDFLRWHYGRNFSEALYEEMLMATSARRPLVASPCLYAIYGDPATAEENFSRVYFYCSKGERATNSVDLQVLREKSYRALLTELARINGFKVSFPNESEVVLGELGGLTWECYVDGKKITDFSATIQPKATVECFYGYSVSDIKEHYAKK